MKTRYSSPIFSKIALHQPQQTELSIETVTRETARQYKLYNISFSEACEVNAAVARSLGRGQVALTWNVLKTVHQAASVRSEATRPVSGDITNVVDNVIDNVASDWRQRLRTSSFGRKVSRKENVVVIENSVNNATR